MPRRYKPNVADSLDSIIIQLGWMWYSAPTFEDPSFDELFPGRDFDVVFFELNESLADLRSMLGEQRYQTALATTQRMRSLFEADPKDTTGQTKEGRQLVRNLQVLLEEVTVEQGS